jgi:hypothetical protein
LFYIKNDRRINMIPENKTKKLPPAEGQITFIAFVGSITIAGATLILTGLTLSGEAALQLVSSGNGLMVIGLIIAILSSAQYPSDGKKNTERFDCLPSRDRGEFN